jgi:hypothetical protein
MIKKLIVAAMLIATFGISGVAYAQGDRPAQSRQFTPGGKRQPPKPADGKVTSVKVTLRGNPPSCDWVVVDGVIRTDGPAKVKFKWVIGSADSTEGTLKFLHGGYKKVWITAPTHLPRGTSMHIKVLSPNEVQSNKVPVGELCG